MLVCLADAEINRIKEKSWNFIPALSYVVQLDSCDT